MPPGVRQREVENHPDPSPILLLLLLLLYCFSNKNGRKAVYRENKKTK